MPPPRDVRDLSRAILGLARSYQLRDRNRVCRHGLTVSQCYALEHIAARTDVTVTELAGALGLDKSTTSRVVDGLRAAGLAAFAAAAPNRRAKPLVATPRGRALDRTIHDEILAEHASVLAAFTAAERKACRAMLDALMSR